MRPLHVTTYIRGHSVHKYEKNKNQSHEVLPDTFLTDGRSHWDILERGRDSSKSSCQLIPPQNAESPALNKEKTSPETENKLSFEPMLLIFSFNIHSKR